MSEADRLRPGDGLVGDEVAKRLRADREVARRNMGVDVSDEEFDRAPDILGNIYNIAAERLRAARGAEG
ncbi:hypothetical protein [Streptomyces cavernicola]|uniref:Uncharacterized protein n=1 Tax=Streptomyces cavernicola TaxID=3043613 RepID=A0ABT6SNT3_9ACTN|nr:hypothetical protein [Streptomyces sp. B-S-A6]MDI3409342.1 hypothetical protein [Streptomyces sp. B-S-A6]